MEDVSGPVAGLAGEQLIVNRRRLMELCPYHHVEPSSESLVAREEVKSSYTGLDGAVHQYCLPRLEIHRVFCRMCRDGGSNAFGRGFSAPTPEKAADRWNKACATAYLRVFKKAVNTGS